LACLLPGFRGLFGSRGGSGLPAEQSREKAGLLHRLNGAVLDVAQTGILMRARHRPPIGAAGSVLKTGHVSRSLCLSAAADRTIARGERAMLGSSRFGIVCRSHVNGGPKPAGKSLRSPQQSASDWSCSLSACSRTSDARGYSSRRVLKTSLRTLRSEPLWIASPSSSRHQPGTSISREAVPHSVIRGDGGIAIGAPFRTRHHAPIGAPILDRMN
jgi:hypothetical protein